MQDQLIYDLKQLAHKKHGDPDQRFIVDALFSTVTNVNFDAARFNSLLDTAASFNGPSPNDHKHNNITERKTAHGEMLPAQGSLI